jgi:serine O-acetyltransferase
MGSPALTTDAVGIDRVTLTTVLRHAKSDTSFILEQSGRRAGRAWLIRWLLSRSARAAMVMRMCGQTSGLSHVIWKEILGTLFASDVASGAVLGVPLYIPHPTGIVIGSGSVVHGRVALFQHVTLGRGATHEYPEIESGSAIYTGATLVGAVHLPPGSRVRAHALIVEPTAKSDE